MLRKDSNYSRILHVAKTHHVDLIDEEWANDVLECDDLFIPEREPEFLVDEKNLLNPKYTKHLQPAKWNDFELDKIIKPIVKMEEQVVSNGQGGQNP